MKRPRRTSSSISPSPETATWSCACRTIGRPSKDCVHIARRHSPDHIIWRFDPLCITDKLSFEKTEARFSAVADRLRGNASSCTISFAHPYRKRTRNIEQCTDNVLVPVSLKEQRAYATRLASRAATYGIRLLACCNDRLLSDSIGKARCIDGGELSLLFGTALDARPAASRTECGCTKSIDIGVYDTCGHGCVCCYADTDQEKVSRAPSSLDPAGTALSAAPSAPRKSHPENPLDTLAPFPLACGQCSSGTPSRAEEMRSMISPLVTAAVGLPGCRIARDLGGIRGIVVRSRSIVGNIGAANTHLQGIFGLTLSPADVSRKTPGGRSSEDDVHRPCGIREASFRTDGNPLPDSTAGSPRVRR